ncbi:Hypp7121 [Branchiostoma lanceolatum]|uniref:Hypp7121 protein n=1 Tax=Branchiostoma lanceolatum TaxID=7740 RepID=A0A8K0E7J6_BRALA|nr:Hypp7121 [Branchiostoma lanceolatum]
MIPTIQRDRIRLTTPQLQTWPDVSTRCGALSLTYRGVTQRVQVTKVSSADLVASAPGSGEGEAGSRTDMAPAKRDQKVETILIV